MRRYTYGARSSLLMADDLVDCVLRFLTDFDSLSSLMLVSKQVYDVYNRHPVSIVRSVAYSEVGPALPQALRLARHKKDHVIPAAGLKRLK
ncbi:hypothetical protein NEOLEDRAFT_944641 [Neolentinus lepideus HHB14362 ss-1]|uniref:F-box domain-containing protein n=1 Tax=Neolentinus lepideus HHB14362 ss-1 TaxID=1314782 RepID=A0A165NDX5_9AGAM|nr:hypothetical protein NEOLEDRAFT_944641 [Neolentinus lepideus HHB14362 ss-1]